MPTGYFTTDVSIVTVPADPSQISFDAQPIVQIDRLGRILTALQISPCKLVVRVRNGERVRDGDENWAAAGIATSAGVGGRQLPRTPYKNIERIPAI
jgi:hypothetical protein